MKLLIFGSRTFDDYEFAKKQLYYFTKHDHVEVVFSGACSDKKNGALTYTRPDGTEVFGADGIGERWAAENKIPVQSFPAEWDKYGLSAGPRRNSKMANELNAYCDKAIGFHDGTSKGTKDMAKKAIPRTKRTELIEYKSKGE